MRIVIMILGLPIVAVIGLALILASWPLIIGIGGSLYYAETDIVLAIACFGVGIIFQGVWQFIWLGWFDFR